MRTVTLAACLSLLAVSPGPVPAATPQEGAPVHSAPLGDWHGRPLVELTIAGAGPYPFLLDSGAGTTVIDHALAERSGFETLGTTEIGSPLGGTVPATRVRLADVRMAGVELGAIDALQLDLATVVGSGDAPVGVLATAALGEGSVTIDLGARRVSVGDAPLPAADDAAGVFDFCSAHGTPSLHVEVGGQRHCVDLDTGSPSVLALPLAAAQALSLAGPPAVVGHARLVGAEVEVLGARLDGELRVGPLTVRDPDLTFMDQAPIGNLGQGFLRDAVVTIDHRNRRVRVRPGRHAAAAGQATTAAPGPRVVQVAAPAGRKRYGMRLMGSPGSSGAALQVAGVDAGSPAEAGGLRQGDVIVALNGAPAEQLDPGARMTALRGSPLQVTVRRDGELHELTLSLD